MINAIQSLSASPLDGGAGTFAAPVATGGASFADALRSGLEQVAALQQDAGQQVVGLATGQTDNLSGVMTSVEKGDLAFKTLLAIRGKLMDAYEELRGMQM